MMVCGSLAYHVVARHGYAIERLKRDMAAEAVGADLPSFLAYDAANFVWGFILASGNLADPRDRSLRNELEGAVAEILSRHGIDQGTFVVRPERDD